MVSIYTVQTSQEARDFLTESINSEVELFLFLEDG
jgi:hypothetical protein